MSGFAAGIGKEDLTGITGMLEAIAHRGNAATEIYAEGDLTLGQTYLAADLGAPAAGTGIPVGSDQPDRPTILYDGQIGNTADLARRHDVADGPLREERVLQALYEEKGADCLAELDDAIFAFAIADRDRVFAARDVLGIKTLFYGREGNTLYLASELKGLLEVTDNVREFPAGHYLDRDGNFVRFADLAPAPRSAWRDDLDDMLEAVRSIIRHSVRQRVDFSRPTGALLSGGMDSSVICLIAGELYKQKYGADAKLPTFAVGVGESEDIERARLMAEHLGTDHHELIVDPERLVEVLPKVIYYLENFDPSLVRSAACNYLVSQFAADHGIEIVLSGEGGDEVFCGYTYLKQFPSEELPEQQIECLRFLHNNASLRLDRMNQCHGVKVVAPLISGELLEFALTVPPQYKQRPKDNGEKIEKWIFRKAFEDQLPEAISWRLKQEFSQGSGSAAYLPNHFEELLSDEELAAAQKQYPQVRSKEELAYFRLFVDNFGDGAAVATVGQWICL